MLKHFFSTQFLRFLAVGTTAAFLNWLTRIGLSIWLPFEAAVLAAYTVGMVVAFSLNSLYVFPNAIEPKADQIKQFLLINLAFLPVVWVCSLLFLELLEWLGIHRYREAIAHGLAIAMPTIATFLLYKFFAFRETSISD